eukprot:gene23158-24523_t
MLKKIVAGLFGLVIVMAAALAQVDVNKADQAALDGIKGIGPTRSKAILEERKKGAFKDWGDFENRVSGIGEKSATKLSDAGLTVNGQPRNASTATPTKAIAKNKAGVAEDKASGSKN